MRTTADHCTRIYFRLNQPCNDLESFLRTTACWSDAVVGARSWFSVSLRGFATRSLHHSGGRTIQPAVASQDSYSSRSYHPERYGTTIASAEGTHFLVDLDEERRPRVGSVCAPTSISTSGLLRSRGGDVLPTLIGPHPRTSAAIMVSSEHGSYLSNCCM